MIIYKAAAADDWSIVNLRTPLEPSYSISSLPAAFLVLPLQYGCAFSTTERRDDEHQPSFSLAASGINPGLYDISGQIDISNRPRHLLRTSSHFLALLHHNRAISHRRATRISSPITSLLHRWCVMFQPSPQGTRAVTSKQTAVAANAKPEQPPVTVAVHSHISATRISRLINCQLHFTFIVAEGRIVVYHLRVMVGCLPGEEEEATIQQSTTV